MAIDVEKLNSLSKKERQYFNMMRAHSGVLYIKSAPGIAKSAIAKNIAEKMGYQYIDLRLSMLDETDIGLYPIIKNTDEATPSTPKGTPYIKYAIPEWAIKANNKPTIIHFEELNRAQLTIRNAALQILHERCIGFDFCFNDDVLMMSSGNLGEDDGTDVEEFDAALNNRLIHKKHELTISEWKEGFANEHVHPLIVDYIDKRPNEFYRTGKDNGDNMASAYATPRSWTFLSDYIIANHGKNSTPEQIIPDMLEISPCYIGASAAGFTKFLDDLRMVSILDVINNYEKVKERIEELGRSKKSELTSELRAIATKEPKLDIKKLTKKQMANVVSFLKTLNDDELTSYLLEILDRDDWADETKKEKSNMRLLKDSFVQEYMSIREVIQKDAANKK